MPAPHVAIGYQYTEVLKAGMHYLNDLIVPSIAEKERRFPNRGLDLPLGNNIGCSMFY
jgi:hypothetical protein